MKLILISIFILSFSSFSQDNITKQLHDYIFATDYTRIASLKDGELFNAEKMIKLVDEGADPHALAPNGANSLHLIVESWSNSYGYDEAEKELRAEYLKGIKHLTNLKVDASAVDYRGLAPLYYIHHWGVRGYEADQLINVLLEAGADINIAAKNGWRLLHTVSRNRKVLGYIENGMNILAVNDNGYGAAAVATSTRKNKDGFIFKEIVEKLSAQDQNQFVNQTVNDGNTPLHFAVMKKNYDVVEYLVVDRKVDINLVNQIGYTPVDFARLMKHTKIEKFLIDNGAEYSVIERAECSGVNNFKVNLESVLDLINRCNLKKIEDLIKLLPKRYLSRHVTAYFSHAVQSASGSNPLITVFGEDGHFMMNFNGSPSQRGYKNLEVIQYRKSDDEKVEFEFRDIVFPENDEGEVFVSRKNPVKCMGCHGNNPKPLWDSWTLWPGKFGSDSVFEAPNEEKYVDQFRGNSEKGRYKYLPKKAHSPIKTAWGYKYSHNLSNLMMDEAIESLMAQKIAADIKTMHGKYRLQALAAVSCSGDIALFFNEEAKNDFRFGYDFLESDTVKRSVYEAKRRIHLQEHLVGDIQGRYVYFDKIGLKIRNDLFAGRNIDFQRTAKLRYVIENTSNFDMSAWFTPFNNGKDSYSIQRMGLVELMLWQELISEDDKELHPLFEKVYSAAIISGPSIFSPFIFETSHEKEVCEILKKKSLLID